MYPLYCRERIDVQSLPENRGYPETVVEAVFRTYYFVIITIIFPFQSQGGFASTQYG